MSLHISGTLTALIRLSITEKVKLKMYILVNAMLKNIEDMYLVQKICNFYMKKEVLCWIDIQPIEVYKYNKIYIFNTSAMWYFQTYFS